MQNKSLRVLQLAVCMACCGYASENLVDEVGRELPPRSSKQPICVVRDVMPGQMVHVKFRMSSETRPDAQIAFALTFRDVDGGNCDVKWADISHLSKFTSPVSQAPQNGRDFEIKRIAPPYAVSLRILLQSSVDDADAKVDFLDLDIRSPSMLELLLHSNVWWRYMPWLAFAAFVLVLAVGIRRLLQTGEAALKHRIRGMATVSVVAVFVAYAVWCLGDVFASDHYGVIQSFTVFALALFVLYSVLDGLGEESFISKHPVLCLSVLSICVHVLVIVLCNLHFHQHMTSDSWRAQQCLELGRISVKASPKFPYWCNYELFLSVLGLIFRPRLYIGQVVNALCCVGVFYPIYDLAQSLTGRKGGLFALVAFALYPTNYFHATLLTQEYLCSFMVCWAIWFAWRAFTAGMASRRGGLFAVMCGLALGLSQLIKPVSAIVLIALAMVACVWAIGGQRREVLGSLIMMAVVILSFALTAKCGQEMFCELAGPRSIVDKNFARVTRMLSCGLDIKGRGRNTVAFAKRYPSRSTEENKRLLRQSLRNDYVHYPVLMAEKFDRVYGSEEGLRRWFRVSLKSKALSPFFIRVVENYYFLFRLLCFIGAICFMVSAFSKDIPQGVPKIGMLIPLFLCGFCAMLMLSEAQARYRVPTHPESFIMLAYSHLMFQRVKCLLKRFKEWMDHGHEEVAA